MANKLKFTEKFIEIRVDKGDMSSLELVAQIPYIHRNKNNTVFRTTPRNVETVLKLFRSIDLTTPWEPTTANFLINGPASIHHLLDIEIHRRSATKSLIEMGPTGDGVYEYIRLRPHQQLAVELAEVNDKWAFFYDTRTGKTPLSLSIVQQDIALYPNHKWLVLCPLVLIENAWLLDARDMFPTLKVVGLHAATKKERLKLFEQDANLYVLNIESFIAYREYVERLGIHGCFVDESSTMKSHNSKFAQAAVDYAWTLKRWYLLSGSPAPNGEHEYYRQLQSVDFYGIHESWNQFKKYFFDDVSRNVNYEKFVIKDNRHAEFLRLLREYSLYVDKEDVLTTPGRDFIEVPLKLPEKLRENYEQLRKLLYVELGDGLTITAPSTAASLNKLNQVTSGFLIDTAAMKHNRMLKNAVKEGIVVPVEYSQPMQENYFIDDYRFVELDKLLLQLGDKQVIIWAHYRKEFEIMKERLGDRCECIYGATGIAEKNAYLLAFKQGKVQYLIANPQSIGKGVTLTNCHINIYFSLSYSYENWKQSIERIYGDVSKQPLKCLYYIFIATTTIDRTLYATVTNKGSMSSAVLNHLKGGM